MLDRDCTKRRRRGRRRSRRRRRRRRKSGEQDRGDTLGCFALENGTDRLFLNVGHYQPTLRNILESAKSRRELLCLEGCQASPARPYTNNRKIKMYGDDSL